MPLTGAAAARLYDDHVDAVHAMIARRVGPEVAPGVTAEAFEHALRTWDRFDVGRGAERLFLYGAACAALRRHETAESEYLRGLRFDLEPSSPIDDPLVDGGGEPRSNTVASDGGEPENEPDDDSPERRMLHAIADLAPDDRDILLLSLWESCPQSAIAEALDMTVGTVRSALGRIRRELKIASAGTTA